MGLVIVVLRAPFGGYDALADPVGWGLVLAGLLPLKGVLRGWGTVAFLAAVAAVVSVPLWLPVVADRIDPSGQWAVSLPQAAFCVALCSALSSTGEDAGAKEADRFGVLRWAFVVVAAAPVLVYGGGMDALAAPVAVLAVLANVALVYLLFKVSRRPWTTGTTGTTEEPAPS